MKIAISATNPCHLYELALALHRREALAAYHSGYPGWKLKPPAGFPLRQHVWRTLVTYGLNRLPGSVRPEMLPVFRWQDEGFDRAVARILEAADAVHAMPGQARETLRRARELGAVAVLNHATGPLRRQGEILAEAGHPQGQEFGELVQRHEEEYGLADVHVVASTLVRDQLVEAGVESGRIRVIPYAADPTIFYPGTGRDRGGVFRMLFAGQLTARKGLETLRQALNGLPDGGWELVVCGGSDGRFGYAWMAGMEGKPIRWLGAVSRKRLAEEMRAANVLVLPSLEEGFGLVVPQALACGCPCVVSDRVGAKDLIRHRENGAIVAAGDAGALAAELAWWRSKREEIGPIRLEWSWDAAASQVAAISFERQVGS